jgi:hypothetical protein
VETSRLGDISIVVTLPNGDISNVAAWGHYQSRATVLKLLERKSLTDRGRQPQSAGKIPTIDPPIEREPQFVIIASVLKDPSIRAYWGDVESTFHAS